MATAPTENFAALLSLLPGSKSEYRLGNNLAVGRYAFASGVRKQS